LLGFWNDFFEKESRLYLQDNDEDDNEEKNSSFSLKL